MMQWRLNKEIPFSAEYTAKFYTLYEDMRDMMCDSPRPDWGIAERKNNRMVRVVDYRGVEVFSKKVSREEGNRMYMEMKPLDHYGYGYAECHAWLIANGAKI